MTTRASKRQRARTPRRVQHLLNKSGLVTMRWLPVEHLGPVPLIQAVIAARPSIRPPREGPA